MKHLYLYYFLFIVLFISCDSTSRLIIEVNNESQYDLRLIFIYNEKYFNTGSNEIDVLKYSMNMLIEEWLGPTAPNPNIIFDNIIIMNIHDQSVLLKINNIDLFEFKKQNKTSYNEVITYSLKIKDEMLFKQ